MCKETLSAEINPLVRCRLFFRHILCKVISWTAQNSFDKLLYHSVFSTKGNSLFVGRNKFFLFAWWTILVNLSRKRPEKMYSNYSV